MADSKKVEALLRGPLDPEQIATHFTGEPGSPRLAQTEVLIQARAALESARTAEASRKLVRVTGLLAQATFVLAVATVILAVATVWMATTA